MRDILHIAIILELLPSPCAEFNLVRRSCGAFSFMLC